MNSLLLIKLTENDKRIIFVLLAVVIILLVLIAYIGFLVTKVMKWQGKKINNYVTDAVVTGVITDEKQFIRYAKRKNSLVFYHQGRIPALILHQLNPVGILAILHRIDDHILTFLLT